jgi:hypothetical protein
LIRKKLLDVATAKLAWWQADTVDHQQGYLAIRWSLTAVG